MRCELWAPERGSHEVNQLVGPLAELVDLTVVCPRSTAPGVEVTPPDDADPSALRIYHFGADRQAYGWMYESLLRTPGVVVLHDLSLLDFYIDRCGGVETEAFAAEVRYAHGPIRGLADDPTRISGWPTTEVDGTRRLNHRTLTMRRRVVDAARAVVVGDPATAEVLRTEHDNAVIHHVPHGTDIVDDDDVAAARARLGYSAEEVVFTVFDGSMVAALAFDQVGRMMPNARLAFACASDARSVEAVRQLGEQRPGMRLDLDPSRQRRDDLLCATDVLIALEDQADATIMRAFGAGKVAITIDHPRFRHLDSTFCRLVPANPADQPTALVRTMLDMAHDPSGTRAAGSMARRYVRDHASWPVVAKAHADLADAVSTMRRPVTTARRRGPGVNVFADLRADTGLAEGARRHACALLRAGANMTVTEVHSFAPHRTTPPPPELLELPAGKHHPIDLWTLNLSEFELVPQESMDRYTVAIWAWEMPVVYDETVAQLRRLDELWVVSSFVADAFRTVTDMPITVIGNVVEMPEHPAPDRVAFGLPADAVIVLFSFSASSSDARKNPYGVIEAFRRAFAPAERGRQAHLVIKAVDLDDHPGMKQHLANELASVHGTLISRSLTRPEMDTLLATCDIYVSLHRSEGFGLGIAEAMALGKPVIATGYGGNTDFMPSGAGVTIGYTVRDISEDDHRFSPASMHWYKPGQMWAEPNVGQAARWLRLLAQQPDLRERVGHAGAAAVEQRCSMSAVGARMLRRLEEIDPTRTRYRT